MKIEIFTTGDTHEITDIYANGLDYIVAVDGDKAVLSLSPTDAVLLAKELLAAASEYNKSLFETIKECSSDLQKN